MACNCNNGQTSLISLVPAPGATAESAVYSMELIHYTCGNRKICVNGGFPLSANLNYQVLNVYSVGNETYNCDILVSGTVTYMPYRQGQNCGCGCQCSPCPITENVWTTVSIPLAVQETPAVNPGICVVSPTNVRDCCSVTNAMSINTSFEVVSKAAATAEPSGDVRKK